MKTNLTLPESNHKKLLIVNKQEKLKLLSKEE